MKCEEFKKHISASTGNEAELEQHLASCPACDAWVQKELASPPEGLTPAQWHDATARCFHEKLPENVEEAAPDFWQFFFNGLKYGLVFGLSLVTGFAVLEHLNPQAGPAKTETVEMLSFVDDIAPELPEFVEKTDLSVTFYDIGESKFVSFLPMVQMQSFYEIDQEEETWNENSG
ncbi:MAG: hypothetical protein PHD82_14870 [Candidatus Riflebacteria bacterium]|nr:hypothetical protein [Candidatus Riflebacteria bacterium]